METAVCACIPVRFSLYISHSKIGEKFSWYNGNLSRDVDEKFGWEFLRHLASTMISRTFVKCLQDLFDCVFA